MYLSFFKSKLKTKPLRKKFFALSFGTLVAYGTNEYFAQTEDGTIFPTYTRDEVKLHNAGAETIWVTYKNGVYDITNFIDCHPGGKAKILLAAGGALDPFWAVYGAHEKKEVCFPFLFLIQFHSSRLYFNNTLSS
jgi:hypothetical protein